ncbi:MAG: ankyrin repeat domain-containing protein [Rickettsiaceae bacterium]
MYDYNIQENLKNSIRENNLELFQTTWTTINNNDKYTYLYGVKDEGRCLLSWAGITKNSSDIMKYLIDELGVYVDHQDGKSRTALSGAVEYGYEENVRFLLTRQANPNLQDYTGSTTLHVAAKNDCSDNIFQLLFAGGADIKLTDTNGSTALHHAAKHSLNSMHSIIKYKGGIIDINQQNLEGETPLHYAAEAEDNGINAGYLLRLGANSTIQSNNEKTAVQMELDWSGESTISNVIFGYRGETDHEAYYESQLELLGEGL